ncbi:ATP-binding cassette domain-containing protein [Oscillospiraceae bacterium PP1C4]
MSTFKALVHPVYNDIVAVDKISFNIDQGEIVGFIGPNGAGKTTTLKMLTGLLYPTAGNICVSGFVPYERTSSYLKSISLVMGNKSQLNPSITVMDSFYITKEIYQISDRDYRTRLDNLVSLLEINELLPKLSRNLSLGERAKCEFAAALLYQPKILFLDEPTLGMDVSVQIRLRNFIKEYNQKYGTTILLTSHYMADITSLCSRTMLINKGKLIYDGSLEQLSVKLSPFKLIKATFQQEVPDILEQINCEASNIGQTGLTYTIRVKKEDVSKATVTLLNTFSVNDLSIENPSIEAVIDQAYQGGLAV